jgi:phosphoenolpyruvate carboxylase
VPADEPYRRLLAQLRERLLATRDHCEELLLQAQAEATGHAPLGAATSATFSSSGGFVAHVARDGHLILHTTQELLDPLLLCFRSLEECGDGLVARGCGTRDHARSPQR